MPVCPRCGHTVADGFRFCPDCGAAVGTAPIRGSRKTVTVLFCDLVGSTALGESVAAGRHAEATAVLDDALGLYESKQIVPLARRTRERLAALQPVET